MIQVVDRQRLTSRTEKSAQVRLQRFSGGMKVIILAKWDGNSLAVKSCPKFWPQRKQSWNQGARQELKWSASRSRPPQEPQMLPDVRSIRQVRRSNAFCQRDIDLDVDRILIDHASGGLAEDVGARIPVSPSSGAGNQRSELYF